MTKNYKILKKKLKKGTEFPPKMKKTALIEDIRERL